MAEDLREALKYAVELRDGQEVIYLLSCNIDCNNEPIKNF